jgi:hypothetical protein
MALNNWILNKIAKFNKQYYSPLNADGNSGTAKTLDFDLGNEHRVVMTGNCTFTFSNPVDGGRYVVALFTGAGGFTAAWPANVIWPGNTPPVLTLTASVTDIFTFIYVATTNKYHGAFAQNYPG